MSLLASVGSLRRSSGHRANARLVLLGLAGLVFLGPPVQQTTCWCDSVEKSLPRSLYQEAIADPSREMRNGGQLPCPELSPIVCRIDVGRSISKRASRSRSHASICYHAPPFCTAGRQTLSRIRQHPENEQRKSKFSPSLMCITISRSSFKISRYHDNCNKMLMPWALCHPQV